VEGEDRAPGVRREHQQVDRNEPAREDRRSPVGRLRLNDRQPRDGWLDEHDEREPGEHEERRERRLGDRDRRVERRLILGLDAGDRLDAAEPEDDDAEEDRQAGQARKDGGGHDEPGERPAQRVEVPRTRCAQTAMSAVGMPTVNSTSTEPFRSSIGKIPMTIDVTTRRPTVMIRLRNSRRMLCIPLRMRWPSSTAGASEANESFVSTMSATARAAWLPLCIAIPRFAFLSERTSFTPSPIIAT